MCISFAHFSRAENPPPYQSEGSLHRRQESDRDSLDDYEEGPQFKEDGSFVEEYGDKKKEPADEKDHSALATFVWGELEKGCYETWQTCLLYSWPWLRTNRSTLAFLEQLTDRDW